MIATKGEEMSTLKNYLPDLPMTPKEIVHELDQFIIGQDEAKRAVAIALRNRWRRKQLPSDLQEEIYPKNILMIGPTGVGKTEIARRLAKLSNAPFIKIEATKFTEVGYVGRDVESIIRELVDIAFKMIREQEMEKVKARAKEAAIEVIIDKLLPPARPAMEDEPVEHTDGDLAARKMIRNQLLDGQLDDQMIEINLAPRQIGIEIMAPAGMEDFTGQIQDIMSNFSGDKKKTKKVPVKTAIKHLTETEAAKMVNEDDIRTAAVESVEQNGIVFLDEIDKIAGQESVKGAGVSREGVQRDLLPIIEGSTINTKYGMIKTDHILFIASGAFHLAKPSDLIPELQGRLPIRVELNALSAEDFERILTEPNASLVEQYIALMSTEGLTIKFHKDAIREVANIAFEVNEQTENIGARRLHTVMERLLEEISFTASDQGGETIAIDKKYVANQIGELAKRKDLSQYIL